MDAEDTTSSQTNAVMLDISDTEMIQFETVCRLCANHSEKIMGIYSEEGVSNGLPIKINMYLPIKVGEGDTLPLQCCWNCVSAVLAWHELVVTSVEAERRLRDLQILSANQLQGNEDAKICLGQEHETELPLDVKWTPLEQQPKREALDDHQHDCNKCGAKFESDVLLTAHVTSHDYNFFCDICNKGYTRSFDMEKHRRSKHCIDNESKLKLKNEAFETPPQQIKKVKLRRRRGEFVASHFCDICNKGFTRKHDMMKHRLKQHPNESVPDALLSKRKEREKFLSTAKVVGPDDVTYYKCKECGKVFKHSYNLFRHQTVHTGVRAYFCHVCGKNYFSSNVLNRHITEHHFGVKKFSCDICGKRFSASAARNEHLNIHTNTRPFVCDICGKSFKQKASLHTHKLFHGNNFRFSCNVCEKKFRRGSELKVHMWMHTGHKPHKCHLCPSMFRLKKDLVKHVRVHDKLNECVCNECGSIFSQEKYLNNHKRTHRLHKNQIPALPTSTRNKKQAGSNHLIK